MFTFTAGTRRQCIPVTLLDDDVVEDDEQFNVNAQLEVPIPGVSVVDGPATVTITDLDSK